MLERKKDKELPESSGLEFLETFIAHNFALSDAEENTSGPLNRGGIADSSFFLQFAKSPESQISGK